MEQKEVRDELIIGRNPVMEALKAGRNIDTIFVSKGERQGSIGKIIATARDAGVLIKETDPKSWASCAGTPTTRASSPKWRPTNTRRWTTCSPSLKKG